MDTGGLAHNSTRQVDVAPCLTHLPGDDVDGDRDRDRDRDDHGDHLHVLHQSDNRHLKSLE